MISFSRVFLTIFGGFCFYRNLKNFLSISLKKSFPGHGKAIKKWLILDPARLSTIMSIHDSSKECLVSPAPIEENFDNLCKFASAV